MIIQFSNQNSISINILKIITAECIHLKTCCIAPGGNCLNQISQIPTIY